MRVLPTPQARSAPRRGAWRRATPALFLGPTLLAGSRDAAAHVLWTGAPIPELVPASGDASTGRLSLPSGSPFVAIESPANGKVMSGGEPLTIAFSVQNFTLQAPNGQPEGPETGYPNVTVDGSLYEATWQEVPLVLNLPDGPHWTVIQPVNNHSRPLFPSRPGCLTVALTHGPDTGAPQVVIWAPARAPQFRTSEVTLSFYIANFAILQPVGQSDGTNEGHIHSYLDGVYFAMTTIEQAFVVTGLTPGQHVLELILVNNDHTAYDYRNSTITAWTVFNASGPASGPSPATAAEATLLEDLSLGSLAVSVLVLLVVAVLGPLRPRGPAPSAAKPALTLPARSPGESTGDRE